MEEFVETANVEFLVDTVHPDYGDVKKGEVLTVERSYMLHYRNLGVARPTNKAVTRKK